MAEQKKKKSLIARSQSYFGDYLLMLIALCVPAVYYCGRRAVFVLLVSVGTSVFCDLTGGLLFYNKILLRDLCAVFTGIAIALMMPPTVPYYIPAIACALGVTSTPITGIAESAITSARQNTTAFLKPALLWIEDVFIF